MKKKFLVLLLALFVLTMNLVSAVECDADLNVTPCDVTSSLTLNTGVHNVNGTITILSNGVTLNGNGATINGGSNTNLIIVSGDDVLVEDLTFNDGFVYTEADGSVFNNLVCSGDGSIGSIGGTNAEFTNLVLNCVDNYADSLWFSGGSGMLIDNVSITGLLEFISNTGSDDNIINNSVFNDDARFNGNGFLIENNQFNSAVIVGNGENTFINNYVVGVVTDSATNTIWGSNTFGGGLTISSSRTFVSGATLTFNGGGVVLDTASTTLNGNGATIEGNGSGMGIDMQADNIVITDIELKEFQNGIIIQANNFLIENSYLHNFSLFGITKVGNISNGIIRNNNISTSDDSDIRFSESNSESMENILIANNNFYSGIFIRPNNVLPSHYNNFTVINNYFEPEIASNYNEKIEFSGLNNSLIANNEVVGGQLWVSEVHNSLIVNITIHDWISQKSYRSPLQIIGSTNTIFDNIDVYNSKGHSTVDYSVVAVGYGYESGTQNITIKNCDWNSFENGTSILFNSYLGYNDDILFENNNINLTTTINSGNDNIQFVDNVLGGKIVDAGTNTVWVSNDFLSDLVLNSGTAVLNGNTFRGLVSDLVVGSSFCDYNFLSDNFYIGGVYSGVNIEGCVDFTEFDGVSTTDFSVVSDWSSVDLVLDNVYGKIDYVSVVDLSNTDGELDREVRISEFEIEVESVDYPELNQTASITFKEVWTDNPEFIYVYRDGELCGVECQNIVYNDVTGLLTLDVTGFSTYKVEFTQSYEPDFTQNDITGMVVDGTGKVLYSFILLAPLIALMLLLFWYRGKLKKKLVLRGKNIK